MATVEEEKITGRKYRLWDAVNQIWKRISYWTAASDVEFDNGRNGEEELEAKIYKTDLVFELDGNDLYITKMY